LQDENELNAACGVKWCCLRRRSRV